MDMGGKLVVRRRVATMRQVEEIRRESRVAACIFYSLAIWSLSESESEMDEKERESGGDEEGSKKDAEIEQQEQNKEEI